MKNSKQPSGKVLGKGVAVPYIIALILGMAAVALLGYWFFVLGGRIGGESITAECQAKQIPFCNAWKATRYASKPPSSGFDFNDRCPEPTIDRCKDLVGDAS